jgi:hypothetical protein
MWFILLLLIIGFTLIIMNFNNDCNCNGDNKVIRFIPRTLNQDIESPIHVTDIHRDMFYEPSPWLKNVDSYRIRKREDINQFFISQN